MKETIQIKGMHCKSCEILIGEDLEEQEGVETAEVSHQAGTLSISYDESKISGKRIREIVKSLGYEVE